MSLASSFNTSSACAYMIDDDRLASNGSSDSEIIFWDRDGSYQYDLSNMPNWKTSCSGSEEMTGWDCGEVRQTFSNLIEGSMVSSGSSEGQVDWNRTDFKDGMAYNILTQIALSHQKISNYKGFSFFWSPGKYKKRCPPPPIPIPGSAFLLGPVLIGLVIVRGKFKR
jgi:hypothetical protein